jgi:hypothetical protein
MQDFLQSEEISPLSRNMAAAKVNFQKYYQIFSTYSFRLCSRAALWRLLWKYPLFKIKWAEMLRA